MPFSHLDLFRSSDQPFHFPGRGAGFMVDRIINEPTAAALSYGLGHMDEESRIYGCLRFLSEIRLDVPAHQRNARGTSYQKDLVQLLRRNTTV